MPTGEQCGLPCICSSGVAGRDGEPFLSIVVLTALLGGKMAEKYAQFGISNEIRVHLT